MAILRMAFSLGRTPSELMKNTPAPEVKELLAFQLVEPSYPNRMLDGLRLIAYILSKAHFTKSTAEGPEDFLKGWAPPELVEAEKNRKAWAELASAFHRMRSQRG